MIKNRSFILAILLIAALGLSACASATPAATATLAVLANSDTPLPSSTPLPSETPRPTDTATPTPTPSITPTPSGTPSPTLSFAGFQVQAAEYRYGGLSLYFVIPGITQPYQLKVNKTPFTCQVPASPPDRLYCSGAYYPAGQTVTLAFYTPDGTDPVFQTSYVVKPLQTATVDPYSLTSASCPVRGINAHCETEHRIADNGACIVSTCVDSCGFWYSVDTCYYKTPFLAPKQKTQTAVASTP